MANSRNRSNNKKKRNSLLWCFWILLLILIAVVFLVRRKDIEKNLQETHFFERIAGKTPSLTENETSKEKGNSNVAEIDLLGTKPSENKYEEATGTEANKTTPDEIENVKRTKINNSQSEKEKTENRRTESEKSSPQKPATTEKPSKSVEKNQEQTTIAPHKMEINLCFITVDSDGHISRRIVKRNLDKSDSPLTDSINALLSGPTLDEKNKNMMTLIPSGTKLLGASVKNGTATLNFSENFEFNPLGVDGYQSQLMQIVYTATQFATVKNVQFLIEGEKKDYLGEEALQWIGSPLTRSSF